MKENDILKIVEDAFDDQITADGWLDDETPMARIEGKQFFIIRSVKPTNRFCVGGM